jgi:1-deoxy-D-xylulose-5-phosphate synthase
MNSSHPPLKSPGDLKRMALPELQGLADEIRQMIVSACLKNGGHLGASLGAVELAIALHFVFDSPREPLVWDVGHQAYAHKLITGRWDRFSTLRLNGGISGFLSRDESEHDVFGAGHSSTALSAALAMAYARSGTGDWSVAIVGDGGLTAGVALEALNNVKATDTGPLLVVLNDNQMSIAPNVGALSQIFGSDHVRSFFDLFGFDYVGPLDGHDLASLIGMLQGIRERGDGKPVLLHVITQKGKGYAPAEESPAVYHGVSPVQEKIPGKPETPKSKTYSEAFGEALCELAEKDPKIVAITAAMPEGTGLTEFARRFPQRFFDVGIAEPHAVTFAAGLATQGYKPVVAIYSTFLQRGLDAIVHDVALQRLGVVFAVDRAGLVGADGPTHHGMFDLAYMGMVPHMTISAPASLEGLRNELAAALAAGTPWMIRYPRGTGPKQLPELPRARNPRVIAVGLGPVAVRLAQAARAMDPEARQISVIAVERAKPMDAALISAVNAAPEARLLVAEEGVMRGGFGQALLAVAGPRAARTELVGYPDEFVPHGSPATLEERVGLSVSALQSRLQRMVGEKAD